MPRIVNLLIVIGLFTAAVWGPAVFTQWPFANSDQQMVIPQTKLLLELSPMLTKEWPGPLRTTPTDEHRLFIGLIYGAIGLLLAEVIFWMNESAAGRLAWIVMATGGWYLMLLMLGGVLSMSTGGA